ncbi:MAG: gliding motility-associated C-terminal domain-containing protein [Thermonemataceae bacterium]|nr:gliding motility-associated C-terminal domain-containing protein [Thermonemataceae bacterium]
MKKILLLFVFAFSYSLTQATHIVGGELQMTYISGTTYRFNLNMYWDRVSTTKDNSITIGIYRRSDNGRIQTLSMPLVQEADLAFPTDTCTSQVLLRFTKLVYQADITLNPANYSNAAGYYAIWDRCCRNNAIINISNPGGAANAFYLEFPAISQGGTPFINNTPSFPTPQASYLCLGSNFTFPFGATDADGDALVYSMVTPFNGVGTNGAPAPTPPTTYPYPPSEITWSPGYSATNAIPSGIGLPLTVDANTGELSGNPNRAGLFVFSVKCEEYRAGIKIGEVRRDYQILVKNCQELNPNPEIRLQLPDASIYQENTLLDLDANETLCLNLQFFDTPGQSIRLKYLPLNDNAVKLTEGGYRPFRNAANTNTAISGVTVNSSGIGVAKFCWKECLYSFKGDEVFEFGIIADDQGCPVKGIDTIFVKMKVRPKFNNPPALSVIAATANFDIPTLTTTPVLSSGQEVRVTFQAFDKDNDSLSIFAVGRGFNIDSLDITFTPKEGKGKFTTDFVWIPDCRFIQLNGQDSTYLVDIILKEKSNTCNVADDSLMITINLKDAFSNVDNFLPANTFTPNGDGFNDYFQMEDLPTVAEFNKFLPIDNCLYRYAGLKIYNRWGKLVYESQERNFKWDGANLPSGVYFYIIDYTSRVYKGTLNLVK